MMASDLSLSGLKAIVIGAGYGGLSVAIELAKRGAKVKIYEAYEDMNRLGDIIMVASNATRVIKQWGDILDRLVKIAACPETCYIKDMKGKILFTQNMPTHIDGFPQLIPNRGELQQLMHEHAMSLGVEIEWSAKVESVFDTLQSAGVNVNGKTDTADVVIGGDGVHSKARTYVTGCEDRPKKSGFAVFRSWFPLSPLADDPLTKHIAESKKDLFKVWIGENCHVLLVTTPALERAALICVHQDMHDIPESWHLKTSQNEMLSFVEGWDEEIAHIIHKIPEDCLYDYKMLWRDPTRPWVSQNGRVVLVGDASHPHLATSAQGGAQAIEDGATLGYILGRLGPHEIPLALQMFEKLRYERTSLTQRLGWETRHLWHQTDWDQVAKDPESIKFPLPGWLLSSDAARHAEENFEAVRAYVQTGTPLVPVSRNVPEDYVHEDWTVESMLQFEGKRPEDGFYRVKRD